MRQVIFNLHNRVIILFNECWNRSEVIYLQSFKKYLIRLKYFNHLLNADLKIYWSYKVTLQFFPYEGNFIFANKIFISSVTNWQIKKLSSKYYLFVILWGRGSFWLLVSIFICENMNLTILYTLLCSFSWIYKANS